MKSLTLSIVIPVYNEESNLKSCLTAIANQTVAPDEVIVVDNNSTDASMAIAAEFPFVTIMHEPIQGWIPPRNTGLNAAKGDILARIDADAKLSNDWVQRAKTNFQDESVAAITGPALAQTINRDWSPLTRLWSLVYFWATEAEFGITVLWGANMALRREAWHAIREQACLDDSLVHEDQDLSYVLAGQNLKAIRDNKLCMQTDGQTYHNWAKFSEYMYRRYQTMRYHQKLGTIASSSCRLPVYKRIPRLLLAIVPGALFIASSLIGAAFGLFASKTDLDTA